MDKGKELEELHFRIDDLVRDVERLKRMVTPEHVAGVVHGAVMEYIDKLPKDANHSVVAAVQQLVEVLSTPTVRSATINLPSGEAKMTVSESRPAAPWLRKQ
jgi:hypothetical protein